MSTCKTCRYWEDPDSLETWHELRYNRCQTFDDDVRLCIHPKCGSEAKEGPMYADGSMAFANDYYQAYWVTGPDFGCIHHEPK
jgi:hypothetical protein